MSGPHRSAQFGLALLLIALAAACGDGVALPASQPAVPAAVAEPLVAAGHVVVVRADRSIATVSPGGEATAVLGSVPVQAGEPDAVAASADGRLVLVSAVRQDDDDSAICAAVVLQVLPDNRLRELADGASFALTADGSRLAYFRYADTGGFCRRTDLVVRDLTDGTETAVLTPDEGQVVGPPPEWPVNWSPDGRQIAHVTRTGAVATLVSDGTTRVLEAGQQMRALAPAWLADGRLVAMHGCCIGGGSVRVDGSAEDLFAVPGPLRSIRAARDGAGAWFVVEEQGLHHWDGAVPRPVDDDAVVASG